MNLNAREYRMSFWKCIKFAYIQDLDLPEIIKCDAEHMYVFISDMHRLKTMLALVVVIVVRYHSFVRSSLLTTSQDFHTQMWQEKSDLGTMNKNGFNGGPDLNVSRVPRAGFDSRPSTSRNRVISPYQGGLETDTKKEKMQNRMHSPWQYATGPC